MIKTIVTDKARLHEVCPTMPSNYNYMVMRDLVDTANSHEPNCVGLAAPQIGYAARVIIVKLKGVFIPMVNPKYLLKTGGFKSDMESCLSLPGVSTRVRRYKRVKVSYYDPIKGEHVQCLELKGLEARIVQHEIDHLNGKTI